MASKLNRPTGITSHKYRYFLQTRKSNLCQDNEQKTRINIQLYNILMVAPQKKKKHLGSIFFCVD